MTRCRTGSIYRVKDSKAVEAPQDSTNSLPYCELMDSQLSANVGQAMKRVGPDVNRLDTEELQALIARCKAEVEKRLGAD